MTNNSFKRLGAGLAFTLVVSMPLLPWRNADDLTQADYAAQGTTFVGTYWYVCPTPGHAKKGMYGKFVVEGAS
ncbi:MAG: sulfocyanin-like copper-binding protein [Acidihalobacter sp.]|jgi:FtsP/CotA-like multicopper oxidase with cupredoxin domain